jgi:acetyltransferase
VHPKKAQAGQHEILGVCRLSKLQGANEAEFAIVISDQYQKQGLGTQLLKLLVQVGRDEKLKRILATILPEIATCSTSVARSVFDSSRTW